MIFYTHVEHSPTKTIYINYFTETHTHTHARTHAINLNVYDFDPYHTLYMRARARTHTRTHARTHAHTTVAETGY